MVSIWISRFYLSAIDDKSVNFVSCVVDKDISWFWKVLSKSEADLDLSLESVTAPEECIGKSVFDVLNLLRSCLGLSFIEGVLAIGSSVYEEVCAFHLGVGFGLKDSKF